VNQRKLTGMVPVHDMVDFQTPKYQYRLREGCADNMVLK